MEAFALLKFWKSSNAKVASGATFSDTSETAAGSAISDPLTEESDGDDDDSFFELELTLPYYNSKFPKTDPCFKKSEPENEIEPKSDSKPQSPISILRSARPKLRVFLFGKPNPNPKSKRDELEDERISNLSPNQNKLSLFTVKFKIEDGSFVPKFTRSNSSSLSSPKLQRQSSDDCYVSSKRFSKDVVRKYLNLIKPLHVKFSKKCSDREKFTASPTRSTASFPLSPRKEREERQIISRFRCKHLGKSKSASSIAGAPSPAPVYIPARNDHPHDGIEGAILHCKRSLNSSKGHSSLSRCSSDPSH